MRSAKQGGLVLGVFLGVVAMAPSAAEASHLNIATVIDDIDHFFPRDGGSALLSLSPNNESWTVFAANVGDTIRIDVLDGPGIVDPVVGLFFATGNGIVDIGDVIHPGGIMVTTCPFVGVDLDCIAYDDDSGAGLEARIDHVIGATGQYAIYASSINEIATGNVTVQLVGNTGSLVVPEPATLLLLGTGLLGVGVGRWRRRGKAPRAVR